MKWKKLHSPFPEFTMIGTKIGPYSFVITSKGEDDHRASWLTNEMVRKCTPNFIDGSPFKTLTLAQEACSQVWKQLRAKQ